MQSSVEMYSVYITVSVDPSDPSPQSHAQFDWQYSHAMVVDEVIFATADASKRPKDRSRLYGEESLDYHSAKESDGDYRGAASAAHRHRLSVRKDSRSDRVEVLVRSFGCGLGFGNLAAACCSSPAAFDRSASS